MTPTHQRIYAVLSDGEPHTVQDLQPCLWDDLADPAVLRCHISTLRKELSKQSEGIVTRREVNGVTTYQLVRVMASPYDT